MTARTLRRAAFVSLALVLALVVAVALTWPPPGPDEPAAGPGGDSLASTRYPGALTAASF